AGAVVARFGLGTQNAVDTAGRNAECAAEADEEGIEVRALPAEIFRFEHEADVAETAAAGLWIPERVVHDPLIDGAGLFHVRVCASRDFAGGGFHDAIGGNKFRGAEEMIEGFGGPGLAFARSGKVDGEVASGDAALGWN